VENWSPDRADILELLTNAEVAEAGLLPSGSNYVFAARLTVPGERDGVGIYKPCRGEAPLWDFPAGLHRRELAAYILCQAAGWGFVPPTVVRDGPHGEGMMQLFIEHDVRQHFFTLRETRAEELKRFAAFDVVANNADRKGGHCLLGTDGRLWGIDHGLTFHTTPKLRTVIWDWAEEPIPGAIIGDLEKLREALDTDESLLGQLEGCLQPEEVECTRNRLKALLEAGRFPVPGAYRSVPWPMV
jgi:uncharacterized repeat protein (TIGR03843 family)